VIWYEFTSVLEERAASMFYPEDGSSTFPQNVGKVTGQMISYPRRQ
jgi:hypothetical protein